MVISDGGNRSVSGRGNLVAQPKKARKSIGSQMAAMLSSLRTGHALLSRNIVFLLLVLISVRS
jgi:hypothetical protein